VSISSLYQLGLVKWFLLFWMCELVALTQCCKLVSFFTFNNGKTQIIMTLSIPGKAKVSAKYCVKLCYPVCKTLLPNLPSGFISQQDGVHAHTAKLAQDILPPTVVNLLTKLNGHQAGELCLNTTRHFIPSYRTLITCNHLLSLTCVQHAKTFEKMFCNIFANLQNIL